MSTGNVHPRGVQSTRRRLLTIALVLQALLSSGFLSAAGKELPELTRPLAKVEALNLALANNGTIRQARKEVEAAAGIAIQTRAILFPKLTSGGTYLVRQDSLIEANRNRTISPVQVDVPAIPELGLAGKTLSFGGGYRDDTKKRFEAGMVPEFDVIRQEVEVANSTAQLVEAQGDYRIAKQELVEQLGYNLPTDITDDLPLNLTTPLVARPYPHNLSAALAMAIENRTEIAALEKEERLRDEAIIMAKAGSKPSVQAFAGYAFVSRVETRNAGDYVNGALAGVQMSWPIFDGFLTKGKVDEAKARRGKAAEAKAETTRMIELQVRSAWSDLRTAKSVLTAQTENIKKAVRSLELATSRYNVGAGTQIDVLNAQTALTDARGFYVDALRNYSVARATLIRSTGADLQR